MRMLNTSFLQCLLLTAALFTSPFEIGAAQSATGSDQPNNSSWPREKYSNGTRLIIYQPQVDDWKNFQDLSWRMAISLTPKGGKTVLGVVEMKGNTNIDNVAKLVVNTQWPLFFDESGSTYYLAVGQQWLTAKKLDGPWSAMKELPPEMSKVPQDKQWSALKIYPATSKRKGCNSGRFLQRQAG